MEKGPQCDTSKKNQRSATKRPSTAAEPSLLHVPSKQSTSPAAKRIALEVQKRDVVPPTARLQVDLNRVSVLCASRPSAAFANVNVNEKSQQTVDVALVLPVAASMTVAEPVGQPRGTATRTGILHFLLFCFYSDHPTCSQIIYSVFKSIENSEWNYY